MYRNEWLLIITLLAAAAPVAAQPRPSPSRIVHTEREAIMPTIPAVVASGIVSRAEWSSDGRYVLAARDEVQLPATLEGRPTFTALLVLWDRETSASTELWRAKTEDDRRLEFEWLTGASVAFALAELPPPPGAPADPAGSAPEPARWLYRVDARRKAVRSLGRVPRDTRLLVAPTQALAVLFSGEEASLRVLRADGTVQRVVRFPDGVQPMTSFWAADGGLIATGLASPKPGDESRAEISYGVDLTSGQLTPRAGVLKAYQPLESVLPIRLRQTTATLKEGGASEQLRPLWLESPTGGAHSLSLVAPDAEWGRLSPRGDAVLYAVDHAVWVLPLLRLPKEKFTQARDAAMRAMLVSNAKQLGLGMMMYAQDHDESLPPTGSSVQDLIMPYVKHEALFSGFVYEHPGGPLSAVANPATTRLGYIPGPGGRAVLFVDGHVSWEKE